ncbi:MAG: hypothetical protein AAGE86_06655 [Pseudomonadota bacterium]
MDKALRDWLSSLRAMDTPAAEVAIRDRVEADGHWGAAGLAIRHSILPKQEMRRLAQEMLEGLGRPMANHQNYLMLAERLGMAHFKALLAHHFPSDCSHRDLLEYNLKLVTRDLKSDADKVELRQFLSARF